MPTAPAPATTTPCPKCTQPLTDAAGLGWCPACGYCRTLAESPSQESLKLPDPEPIRPAEEYTIPNWVWPLALGIALAIGVSVWANKKVLETPFQRALWASLQIAGGILILFVGQFITLMRLAPEDEKLGFKDVILPFRLYGLAFKRLPKFSLSVWCLGWGLAVILCGFFLIGGLDHWLTYVKSNKDKQQPPPPFKRST